MNRRHFLQTSAAGALSMALPHSSLITAASAQGTNAQKPDILFILVDDLGYADVGWHDSDFKTPNLDKIANGGARLEQFYVQPVCTPTRASLMTGRYPMRYGLQVGVIRPWGTYGLPLEERTLPQALREAGYTTAMCGKWHLGSFDKAYWPNARGFDHWYGHLFGAIDYFKHERDGKPDWYRNGEPVQEEGYTTNLLGREAVQLVKQQPKDKPLFLYLPFNGVHAPMQVPESYKEPYAHLRPPRRTLGGMLAALDEAVGQVIDALKDSGRLQNTLIVFSSDNGGPPPGRNTPLRARKGTVYEGGVRSCGAVAWEGKIKPGSVIQEPLHIVDFYPTLINLAGGSLARAQQKLPLDGRDILPCLTEGKPSPHEEILLNAAPNGGALRAGDWKIVVIGNREELFNLQNDQAESTNLSTAQPEKTKALRARYDSYARVMAPPKNANGGDDEE